MQPVTEFKPNRRAGTPPTAGRISTGSSLREMETRRLIRDCVQGDRAAWESLIRMYRPSLCRYAFTLCRRYDDTEDIVEQVLLRLLQNLSHFRQEASFKSWLYSIVRNTYLDMCVRPKYRSDISLETCTTTDDDEVLGFDAPDPSPTPEEACLKNAAMQELTRTIRHLPLYQREVLNLYYLKKLSYRQIADNTGLPLGTVRSRLNRARRELQERLEISTVC